MYERVRLCLFALAIVLAGVGVNSPATAQSLDALRASGAVGERFDGYVQARDGSAQGFVDQVNAKRREIYQQRAAAQGVPADQVGRVYAQQILSEAPKGTWFLDPSGNWMQK